MLSSLEMQHVIETAFLPITCRCEINLNGTMAVHMSEPDVRSNEIMISAISTSQLTSNQSIVDLVHDLKGEYRLRCLISGRRMST